jgi:enoyl-CoA hydratase/carnithine racemase
MTAKVLYDKRGEVAYITLNRPEVKNAIDVEAHELLCDAFRDFRDDLRRARWLWQDRRTGSGRYPLWWASAQSQA